MKILLYLLLIILLLSCGKTSKTKIYNAEKNFYVDMNGDGYNTPIAFSDLLDSVSYIDLEDNELIAQIKKIIPFNNKLYIYDDIKSTIFIFSNRGEFINKIYKKGRARDEYISLDFFDINITDGELNLYDRVNKQINVYSEHGDYLRTVKLESDVIRDFAVLPNGEYLFYTPDYMQSNKRGLWKCDAKGNFIETLVNIDEDFKYCAILPHYFCRINKNTIGLMGSEDFDHIYHITTDTIVLKYNIDTNVKIPKSLAKQEIVDMEANAGAIYQKLEYTENEKLLSIFITDTKRTSLVFYVKSTDKLIVVQKDGNMKNANIFGSYAYGSENYSMAWIPANTVMNVDYLKKKFPNVNENSNPIIEILHIK